MICTSCGSQVPDGAVFCASCGAKMEDAAVAQMPPIQQPPAEGSPYRNQASYANQAPYANQTPYGNANPYVDQSPYDNANPYASQGPYGAPGPYQAPMQNQGYNTNRMPMQGQGFGAPNAGPYPSQPKSTPTGMGGMTGIVMKVGLAAAVVWVVSMLWLPFQTVNGMSLGNMSVSSNAMLVVIVTVALGGATIYDFLSRSGADVLFSGIITIIWTAKSMIETMNAGWDFAIGAYLSIICAVLITVAGFLCWQRSRRGAA